MVYFAQEKSQHSSWSWRPLSENPLIPSQQKELGTYKIASQHSQKWVTVEAVWTSASILQQLVGIKENPRELPDIPRDRRWRRANEHLMVPNRRKICEHVSRLPPFHKNNRPLGSLKEPPTFLTVEDLCLGYFIFPKIGAEHWWVSLVILP